MNKKQKILTILALAVFLVLMWRDKWFYDFWFRGGEHRMTLIKVSHAGPQLCRTRWNRRTLLIARRSISLLSWFATSVFFWPQRQKRVGPLGSLCRARARVREACLLTDAGMMSSTNPAHIYGSRPQSGRGSVNVLRLIATNE